MFDGEWVDRGPACRQTRAAAIEEAQVSLVDHISDHRDDSLEASRRHSRLSRFRLRMPQAPRFIRNRACLTFRQRLWFSKIGTVTIPADAASSLAFLGCGFITQVHSRHLKGFKSDIVASYASRERAKAEEYCRRFHGGQLRGLRCGHRRSARRRRGHRRATGLSSRPDAARARGRQARAGRKAGVSAPRGLPDGDRCAQPGEERRARRRERSLQAAGCGVAEAGGRGRHWRDGVRALHDDREAAEVRRTIGATTRPWRAAMRSSKKAFTGCTSPAASALQSCRSTDTGQRSRAKARTSAPRA